METVLLRPSCSGVMNLNRGLRFDHTPHRNHAPTANEVYRHIGPQVSAPGATIYDQHAADTSTTATTSSRGVSDDRPRMRAANSCRAIRSRRGFTLSRALRTMASTSPPGGVIGRASADGQSTSRAFRRNPAWVGCLVKVPSTGRTTLASYPPLPLDRDCEARVDPDITGTGMGPTTSESTPPAHATCATRPATYLSTRWGTDGHGSAGLPEISEDRAESALLYVFYVRGAALCFSLHHNGGE